MTGVSDSPHAAYAQVLSTPQAVSEVQHESSDKTQVLYVYTDSTREVTGQDQIHTSDLS